MTDLHEIASEQLGWSPVQMAAILKVYDEDRQGSVPTVPICFIDRGATVGVGTKVWHFAVVLDGVVIGERCSIGSKAEIGVGSVIGDDTRIGSGVFLPPHSRIGQRVFLGPNVTCTDDKHPRAGNADYVAEPPVIEDDASVGAGAILLPGVRIGHHARVAAGAIVTGDVAPHAMVRGEPARLQPMPAQWSAGREVA